MKIQKLLSSLPWPVILTMVLGCFLPSSFVLWVVVETAGSERLAAQQRLRNAYVSQAESVVNAWQLYWTDPYFSETKPQTPEAELFSKSIIDGESHSVLFIDGKSLRSYRFHNTEPPPKLLSSLWSEAKQLEFVGKDCVRANERYRKISRSSVSESEKGLALISIMRCLYKTEAVSQALEVLKKNFSSDEVGRVDERGNVIAVSAHLLSISYLDKKTHERELEGIVPWLEEKLNDYNYPILSKQRLLVDKVLRSHGYNVEWRFRLSEMDVLAILELAEQGEAQYLSQAKFPENQVFYTGIDNRWAMRSVNDSAIRIFSAQNIKQRFKGFINTRTAVEGITFRLVTPFDSRKEDLPGLKPIIASIPIDEYMLGWKVIVEPSENDPLFRSSETRRQLFIWVAFLIMTALLTAGIFLSKFISRQMSLNALKNDLISTVSHELKTPLASTRILLDTLLEQDDAFDDRTREYLGLMLRENHRLTHLVDNFLTFSRMERSKHVFDYNSSEVKEIIEKTLSSLGEYLARCAATVDVSLDDNLPKVQVDSNMIVTVLCNLLENACKYVKGKPCIKISAGVVNNELRISVSDNGIGIAQSQQKKIFQRFYRVDQRLSRDTEGSGLGLNIVEYIVKSHRGRIYIESELGKGSRFDIYLPINQEPV